MYLAEFATFTTITVLAAMSPGPDFAIVVKNSIAHSKRAGIYTALGIAAGLSVHVTYSLIGIGLIIAKSILLFNIIKLLGAAYLIYLGFKTFLSKQEKENIETIQKLKKDIPASQAFANGFLTNALNPKATLFFLGVFTQVISPKTPLLIRLGFGIEVMVIGFIWFTLLATTLNNHFVKDRVSKIQHYFVKAMGAVLVGLGLKIAFSSTR